jgi:hypothetical protein
MKKIVWVLILALLLTGCGRWMDGSYASVTPHKAKDQPKGQTAYSVETFVDAKNALAEIVENGVQDALLAIEGTNYNTMISNMDRAIQFVMTNHPIASFAVESIEYEQGVVSGVSAFAVKVTYTRNPDEVKNIREAETKEDAWEHVYTALAQCEAGVLVRCRNYSDSDLVQLVEGFAALNPDLVMEIPQVTLVTYPDQGADRVLDVRFTYQTDREALRQMQNYVQPVFSSAALYVRSEEEGEGVKFARLYTFLVERNDYKGDTSITPTYSLLRHGVGDPKAFATVYAAMCRKVGLDCRVVSGTRNGEARYWNIICQDGVFYHVDLLNPGGFATLTDNQMIGYVWDYSAYPACGDISGAVG